MRRAVVCDTAPAPKGAGGCGDAITACNHSRIGTEKRDSLEKGDENDEEKKKENRDRRDALSVLVHGDYAFRQALCSFGYRKRAIPGLLLGQRR